MQHRQSVFVLIRLLPVLVFIAAALAAPQHVAPAAEARPALAGIKDFEDFKVRFMDLNKQEQIVYAAEPYTIVTNSGPGSGGTSTETIATHAALAKKTQSWDSIFPTTGQLASSGWTVTTMNATVQNATVCLAPAKDGPCLSRYDFAFEDGCWRLVRETVEDSGI